MRIFVSHSGGRKSFIEQIRQRLPPFVELRLDDHELRIGDSVEARLEEAIKSGCDLVMLIVDRSAAKSDWVRKEVSWALQQEKTLARPYLLPIVVEPAGKKLIDEMLPDRKYLSCYKFHDTAVKGFVDELTMELFGLLARDGFRSPTSRSRFAAFDAATALAVSMAEHVRTVVHSHRLENPLTIEQLATELRQYPELAWIDAAATLDLLQRLRSSHVLGGIYFDAEHVYLAKESNFYKRTLFAREKRAIAKAAARLVRSGHRIGIDGGSTTLALAAYLSDEIRAGSINDLEIFTNSVPVAYHLLETLSELEAGGSSVRCRVILMGGWCRPRSLTVIPWRESDVSVISPPPGRLDISFLGTNGLYEREGFAITHDHEVPAKRALLEAAERKVFLVDPSKFEVQQKVLFARFSERLEILTAGPASKPILDLVRNMLSDTPSRLVVV
ncbi:MAG TPA: TIR domain-containing protein [Thermoanaerobaculia bacterium]|nr:TIR domain-containing protein [Thermoanaerobaculia bacterium]